MTSPFDVLRSFDRSKSLIDGKAFAKFFAQNHLSVFRFIYGLHGGPQEDVEDLTAETFLRAWRARKGFSGDHKAALRWVFRIARNLVIDQHRRKKIPADDLEIERLKIPAPTPNPEQRVILEESHRKLLGALQSLPADRREMVVLRYLLGWRVKDIAEYIGKAQNTVTVSLRRSLARMRQDWPD
jgi:RNA polymerase sigma-70 factor (ECF subfamily)